MADLDKIKEIRDVKMAIGESAFTFFSSLFLFLFIGFLLLFIILFIRKIKHPRKKRTGTEKPLTKMEMYISIYIQKLKGYRKIILLSSKAFLLISEYGIYFFYYTPEEGLLEGSYKDMWLSKKGEKVPVLNPFQALSTEYNKYSLENVKEKILLTLNTCYLNVFDYEEEKVIKEKNILSEMDKIMGYEKIYTKEEVEKIYLKYQNLEKKEKE